jgi:pimeloyl-ACP methyl ester carboxylesterase
MITYPLQVAGITTRVLEAGGGVPLVLVHGVGARADRWQRTIEPLARGGYHVYAIDLPGHGFATKGDGFDYSVPGYVDFLAAFLKEVEAERPVLVGTSLGGHIVAALTCRQPDAVRELVLVGSLGLRPLGPEARERMRTGIVNTTPEGIKGKLLRVLHDPALVTPDWIEEEFRINNSAGAAEAFRRLADYFGDRIDDDLVGSRLVGIAPKVPILLVWGAEERSVALSIGEAAHAMLPGSRLVVIAATAHAPYFEKADAFNGVVLDFLAGSPGRYRAPEVSYR